MVAAHAAAETLTDAYGRYLEHAQSYRGLAPGTIEAYGRDGARFLRFVTDHHLPDDPRDLTSRDIQAYANSLSGLSASSIRRMVYSLRGFFTFLQREGAIAVNPTADVTLPKRRRRLPRFPSPDQCQALIAAAHTDTERAVVALLLMGGLRRSEVLGLDAERVAADCSDRMWSPEDRELIVKRLKRNRRLGSTTINKAEYILNGVYGRGVRRAAEDGRRSGAAPEGALHARTRAAPAKRNKARRR